MGGLLNPWQALQSLRCAVIAYDLNRTVLTDHPLDPSRPKPYTPLVWGLNARRARFLFAITPVSFAKRGLNIGLKIAGPISGGHTLSGLACKL